MHIASVVVGPNEVSDVRFNNAHPNMNADVNLQSLMATSVLPRLVK